MESMFNRSGGIFVAVFLFSHINSHRASDVVTSWGNPKDSPTTAIAESGESFMAADRSFEHSLR